MGPVLLLDVGIVVLFVGTRAGELDSAASWVLLTEGKKVVVDELAAVVGVDPLEGERELVFDLGDRIQDARGALTHDRLALHPAGGNVDAVQAMEKFPNR